MAALLIDLGRGTTGQDFGASTRLGLAIYGPEAAAEDLGDGHRLRCQPPEAATPAFCAALLKTLPRAVIAFGARRAGSRRARTMVDATEAYVQRAVRSASARQGPR